MLLREVPSYSQVAVLDFGTVSELDEFPTALDDVVTVWTKPERADDPMALIDVRGVLDSEHGLVFIPTDAQVRIVEMPRFAGDPAELAERAERFHLPGGSRGAVATSDGWPELVWRSDDLTSVCMGWSDPELSVEVLLCALAVDTDRWDPLVRPMLSGALKARYAAVVRDPRTYPPERYPWLSGRPGEALLEYLSG